MVLRKVKCLLTPCQTSSVYVSTWFLDFSTEMSENYLHFQKVFAIRKNVSARIWILVYFLFVCFLSVCTFMVLLSPLGYSFSVNTLVSKILYIFF